MPLDAATRRFVTNYWPIGAPALAIVGVLSLLAGSVAAGDPISLVLEQDADCQQISTTLRARGKLQVADGDSPREMPLQIAGKLQFFEVPGPKARAKPHKVVRFYEAASASITVDERTEETQLSPTRKLVVLENSDGEFLLFSPLGPLTRDDLELVSTQCDPFHLPRLLPDSVEKIGKSWQPHNGDLADLFGLDVVSQSDVKCELTKADEDTAEVQIAGTLEGSTLGAKSTLKIHGTIMVDRQEKRLARVDIQINEKREIGHLSPGFELEATIATTISPAQTPDELTPAKLESHRLQGSPSNLTLDFASPAMGLAFFHDRRWRVTMHRRDLLVLRMSDGGQFVAQCNLSPLAKSIDEAAVESAKFRAQVEQSVSEQQGRVEEVSKATTDDGTEILRIEAEGKVNKVPITWRYYLLTHADGRRAAVVFTLATAQKEQFGMLDHDLIGSLQFVEVKKSARRNSDAPSR